MNKKLGRNDQCWCGSGLKYKKCHMGREKQEPLKLSEVDKQFRKAFSTKECLVPEPMRAECSKNIVKAHTVPKSGSLQSIARNGHVYSHIANPLNLMKLGGRVEARFFEQHFNNILRKPEKEQFCIRSAQ
ncbi:SEC-C metal-binding domain-containing protein [Chloroflexota bacterium]